MEYTSLKVEQARALIDSRITQNESQHYALVVQQTIGGDEPVQVQGPGGRPRVSTANTLADQITKLEAEHEKLIEEKNRLAELDGDANVTDPTP